MIIFKPIPVVVTRVSKNSSINNKYCLFMNPYVSGTVLALHVNYGIQSSQRPSEVGDLFSLFSSDEEPETLRDLMTYSRSQKR